MVSNLTCCELLMQDIVDKFTLLFIGLHNQWKDIDKTIQDEFSFQAIVKFPILSIFMEGDPRFLYLLGEHVY